MYDTVVSARVPVEVVAAIDRQVGLERRTRSNMTAVLLERAVAEPAASADGTKEDAR